jgi:DNA-binding response OmpR family regulator
MTSGKPVILVVEDEVLVGMMAVQVAEKAGFEALWAATADEAIRSSNRARMCAWFSQT